MIKVIELITFLNDAGAENLVKNYCLNIDRRKFDIVVVTIFDLCTDCAVYKSIENAGIKIVSVYNKSFKRSEFFNKVSNYTKKKPYSLFARIWNRFSDRIVRFADCRFEKKTGQKLGKLFQNIKPDVIHAHLHVQNYLRFTKLSSNAKLFYTCHSEPYRYFSGTEYDSTKYLIENNKMQIIALHEDMRLKIDEIFGVHNTIKLNNWIEFPRFRCVSESEKSIKLDLGIPEDSFVMGTVGRIVEYKNQIFLVDVLKSVIDQGVNAVLIIVGEGADDVKNQIKERAKKYSVEDRLYFLGIRQDVERVYKAMDVFMLPSLFEGFSMVAVEAQVAGKKCLISDTVSKSMGLTSKTFFLNCNCSKLWAEYALDNTKRNETFFDINSYDIATGIKELENLYEN